jgi:hypothetical protein
MKKKISSIWVGWIIIILLFGYLGLSALWDSYYIKNYGIEKTVEIKVCKVEFSPSAKGKSYMWVSSGYYFVKGKKYRFSMHKVIPIGTKVKIKYNPRNPESYRLVNPHEFDNYPDEMKVQN